MRKRKNLRDRGRAPAHGLAHLEAFELRMVEVERLVGPGVAMRHAARERRRHVLWLAINLVLLPPVNGSHAGTIDEQMMNAIAPGTNIPEWYGPATRVLREEAAKAGADVRGFQDVGWAGLKAGKTEAKGKPFDYEGPMINHINRSIETTHWLTGMPRDEVFRRGVIRKEIPMYGVGGALTMGSLAAQDRYGDQQ